jgi:hypothetical protein
LYSVELAGISGGLRVFSKQRIRLACYPLIGFANPTKEKPGQGPPHLATAANLKGEFYEGRTDSGEIRSSGRATSPSL